MLKKNLLLFGSISFLLLGIIYYIYDLDLLFVFDTLVSNLSANLLFFFYLFIQYFDYDFLVIGNHQDDIINVIKSFIQNIFTMDMPDGSNSGEDDYDSDEEKVEKIITNLEASEEDLESLGTDLKAVGKEINEENLRPLKRRREDDSDDDWQPNKTKRVESNQDSAQGKIKIISNEDKEISALGDEVKANMKKLGKIYDKSNSEIVKDTIEDFCESKDLSVEDISSKNKPKKS
jgi:hypothetical protein